MLLKINYIFRMRLYTYRYHYFDDTFRPCLLSMLETVVADESCSAHPYHCAVESLEKRNLLSLVQLQDFVFCTPRCSETRSWEVGLYHNYLACYRIGGLRLTSCDFHVMQIFDLVQAFLHAMEILEQSNFSFQLYGLRRGFSSRLRRCSPRLLVAEHPLNSQLYQLVSQYYTYMDLPDSPLSCTHLLDQLCIIRKSYLSGQHLDGLRDFGSKRIYCTRLLGLLYGSVLRDSKKLGLVSRQYLRFGQLEKVRCFAVFDKELTISLCLGWYPCISRDFIVYFVFP